MRLIDADALIKELKYLECSCSSGGHLNDYYLADGVYLAIDYVEEVPTVEERPKGEWEVLDECSNAGVYCSKCHKKVYGIGYSYNRIKMPYCPNCGSYNGHSVRGEGE